MKFLSIVFLISISSLLCSSDLIPNGVRIPNGRRGVAASVRRADSQTSTSSQESARNGEGLVGEDKKSDLFYSGLSVAPSSREGDEEEDPMSRFGDGDEEEEDPMSFFYESEEEETSAFDESDEEEETSAFDEGDEEEETSPFDDIYGDVAAEAPRRLQRVLNNFIDQFQPYSNGYDIAEPFYPKGYNEKSDDINILAKFVEMVAKSVASGVNQQGVSIPRSNPSSLLNAISRSNPSGLLNAIPRSNPSGLLNAIPRSNPSGLLNAIPRSNSADGLLSGRAVANIVNNLGRTSNRLISESYRDDGVLNRLAGRRGGLLGFGY